MPPKFPIHTKDFSDFRYVRSQESSVTTAWGVDWSDSMIARDLLQNFYDSHLSNIEGIKVTAKGSSATVTGCVSFDLNKLFYLASEKTDVHVGQYGEGFKAATACLLRRHPDAIVVAQSGKGAVCVRLEDRDLGDTSVQPLVYDFYESSKSFEGSRLLIKKVTSVLTTEISCALTQFWYEGNSLSGELLAQSNDQKLSVYESTTENGHLFYRGLKRGELNNLPLVLVCDKSYQQVERKISQDRDRKAFDEAVLGTFYSVWANNFFKHDNYAIGAVIDAARPLWENGGSHPLLASIASKRPRVGSIISERFGNEFFAAHKTADAIEQLRVTTKESEWKDAGRIRLPAYFSVFGVENAESFFEKQLKQAEQEAERRGRRSLSPAETTAKEVLEDAVQEFAPELWASFGDRRPVYSIAETEALLGQFKKALPYRTSQVFLATSVFESDFSTAISVFLHEHTHIFGYDGSRGFTDALTWLIAAVIRNRGSIDVLEKRWTVAVRGVTEERKAKKKRPAEEIESEIKTLSDSDLREVLKMLPLSQVKHLINKLHRQSDDF